MIDAKGSGSTTSVTLRQHITVDFATNSFSPCGIPDSTFINRGLSYPFITIYSANFLPHCQTLRHEEGRE